MSESTSVELARDLVQLAAESVLYTIGFRKLLGADETLTGTPVVTSSPALTFSDIGINTEDVNENNLTIAVNKGVQFRVPKQTPGEADKQYSLVIECGTSGGNTRAVKATLKVRV